ncbi:MAG TPA: ABC transporter substrate-binding protein [Terriglobales bacterium]|nr:ABC transporter substrate-binding protein [Terriglobales bacterium]
MRRVLPIVLAALLTCTAGAQTSGTCSCGSNPPGRPAPRSLHPYAGAPDDLRPYAKFQKPYYEHYNDLIEYNGAARDIPDPDLKTLDEIRIGFLAPLYDHPDQALGHRMLNGAQLAVDEANAAGGYCGKPFRIITHNDYDNWQNSRLATQGPDKDSAIWGSASNDAVKMIYDDKVWAMFGSISSESTHIALRLSLKAETPIVNSASTDPTIPETIIPWYFTDIQDDRVQGYTLARHIYTELGLKRVALLRVNDRYGRFGVIKFRDASRRLGHPVAIEQKFFPGDTDFRHQLSVINDTGVDAIVLWTDQAPAAEILKEMRELGMKQRVFGSHRTIGEELIKIAGPAAEGFEGVYPYDPGQRTQKWLEFNARFEAQHHEKPDHFAALAYDAMQVLLQSICRAGLNRGRIRDTLTGMTEYDGVTGQMVFDPNCKNISPLFLGAVHDGKITYRRITMEKLQPYAKVGEDGVQYYGPATKPLQNSQELKIAVFGPGADKTIDSPKIVNAVKKLEASGRHYTLVAIPSDVAWGKAATGLVNAVYQEGVIGVIALDRNAGHLAEQIGSKAFVPVIAISSDRMLTTTNVPWIFRLPEGAPLEKALNVFVQAANASGADRGKIRAYLASGDTIAGVSFTPVGDAR